MAIYFLIAFAVLWFLLWGVMKTAKAAGTRAANGEWVRLSVGLTFAAISVALVLVAVFG